MLMFDKRSCMHQIKFLSFPDANFEYSITFSCRTLQKTKLAYGSVLTTQLTSRKVGNARLDSCRKGLGFILRLLQLQLSQHYFLF